MVHRSLQDSGLLDPRRIQRTIPADLLHQMVHLNILEMSKTILEFETPGKVHDPFRIDLDLDAAKPRQIPAIHVL